MQGIGINTTGKDLSRGGHCLVVSSGQTGYGVQQDNYILLMLHHTLCPLNDHLGHLHMAGSLLVECGGDNLPLYIAPHISNFLRPLVYKKQNKVDLRMILGYCICNLLQNHCLSRTGRRYNKTTLSFSDRTEEVDHTGTWVTGCSLHIDPLIWEQWNQVVEGDSGLSHHRIISVDLLHPKHCKIFFSLFRRPDLA